MRSLPASSADRHAVYRRSISRLLGACGGSFATRRSQCAPLARANADIWLAFGAGYRAAAGVPTLTPQQMANAMAFLGSKAASGVNGITLMIDQGHVSSGITGSYDDPIIKQALGQA